MTHSTHFFFALVRKYIALFLLLLLSVTCAVAIYVQLLEENQRDNQIMVWNLNKMTTKWEQKIWKRIKIEVICDAFAWWGEWMWRKFYWSQLEKLIQSFIWFKRSCHGITPNISWKKHKLSHLSSTKCCCLWPSQRVTVRFPHWNCVLFRIEFFVTNQINFISL